MRSNDELRPVPRVPEGGSVLDFDVPGLEIGVAEYDEGPTGCTVFHFDRHVQMAVDVRGGSVGVIGAHYTGTDAICLAGGSLYGLEATTGIAAELLAQRGYQTGWGKIAVVAGAIVYDFGRRDNAVYPDKELGRAALRAARPGRFPLGPRGAGRSVGVGKLGGEAESAGQGAAFRVVDGARVAVFTVVNALGAIVGRDGRVVRGNLDPATGRRRAPTEVLGEAPRGNTTLTVLVTDQRMGQRELTQLGRQVHASMARAIQPFHGLNDGDVLFACSTGRAEGTDVSVDRLGIAAGEVAWDAVLSSWGERTPSP